MYKARWLVITVCIRDRNRVPSCSSSCIIEFRSDSLGGQAIADETIDYHIPSIAFQTKPRLGSVAEAAD